MLTDENMRVLYVPVGFGARLLRDVRRVADVLYKQSAYYDPAGRARDRLERPGRRGRRGRSRATRSSISERDTTAPTLAAVAADLPFRFSG